MRRRLGVVLLVGISLASPTIAGATEITTAQLRALASQAASGNTSALAALRSVTAVDGHTAPLATALQTTSQSQLHARLLVLQAATPTAAPAIPPGVARQAAAMILAARHQSAAAVSDALTRLLQKIGHALASLATKSPGGPVVFWLVAAAVVLALAVLGARRMLRRLEPPEQRSLRRGATAAEDPAELERDAQAAEARGAFAEAVRLRFRAGLLRLQTIDYRPSLLTTEIARRLRSPQFDALAATFDRVAYGGAPASVQDADAAREGWQRVLKEAR